MTDIEQPALKFPNSASAWTRARQDYLAGDSAPLVAERYGLSERTLRRRAAAEGWRRSDHEVSDFGSPPLPPSDRRRRTLPEALAGTPELAEVHEADGTDQFFLLFDPDPSTLRLFAFRRAAEAAASDKPQAALTWMRLVQSLDRSGDRIVDESRPFKDVDYLRAAYLRRLGTGTVDPANPEAESHGQASPEAH